MSRHAIELLLVFGVISLTAGKPLIADVLKAAGQTAVNTANTAINTASNLLQFENVNNGDEGFNTKYETEDGTYREEKGEFVNGVWTVTGVFSWLSPDDKRHTVRYTADDNGYQPEESDDLPPGAIGRSAIANKGARASLLG